MGCPDIYYRKVLQCFAHCLNYTKDKKKAALLSQEESCEVLEKEIMQWKNELHTKDFYYQAGLTTEHVLNDADTNDGCDGLNACLGGLNMLEEFIGIENGE